MLALDTVMQRHGGAIARVAASYEADRALREDLVQEILLAIHHALPRLRDPDRLAPFVFRIAHNLGVDHVLRQSAQRRAVPEPPPDPPDPEASAIADDRARRLAAAVRRLPLPYRQVVTLVLEELSHAEIAEALGIGTSNVAVRVSRAKGMLREMLDGG